jgi:hypothetical protein
MSQINIFNKKKQLELCTLYIFIKNLRFHEEGFINIINYFCTPQKLVFIPNFTNQLIENSKLFCYSYNMRRKCIE